MEGYYMNVIAFSLASAKHFQFDKYRQNNENFGQIMPSLTKAWACQNWNIIKWSILEVRKSMTGSNLVTNY